MDTEDRLARAAVFVGVAVVVALVVGLVAALGSPGPADTGVAYPNATDIVPDVVEASDETAGEGAVGDEPRVVLIDDSHANRYDEDDLRPLLDALGGRHDVIFTSDNRGDLEGSLARADAYVVIDPSFPHTAEEVDEVGAFVEDGGRLVMLGEPTRVGVAPGPFGGLTDIRSRLGELGATVGVRFGTDYLYDEVNNEGNYKRVLADGRNDLDGERAALYTATTVTAPDGTPLLVTAETARLSAQSEARRHPVAVRSGEVVAVGDTTFLTGGKAVVADNEQLVRALAAFAVGGERTRDVADYPYFLPEETRVRYTSGELVNATKAVTREVRASGRSVTASTSTRSLAPQRTDVLVTTFDDLEGINTPETGIEVTSSSVSVPGYDGPRDAVAVVHRPEGPIDLVIVADSPERAAAVVAALNDGSIRDDVLSDRTAVVAGPVEDDEGGSDGGPTTPEPTPTPAPNGSTGTPPLPALGTVDDRPA
jgi:hypothetical protein